MSPFLPVNASNFDQSVLKSPTPVLLEFGATWCGPCKRLEPMLEQLAKTWAGKVQIAKMDVDENVDLVTRYQIMSVPTVILFVKGEEAQRMTGLQPLERIVAKFEQHI